MRTAVCGRCLVGELDRGVWALSLVEQEPNSAALSEMLSDEDWAVRWGAIRGQAKARGVIDLRQLATWVLDAHGATALLACETALHVAGGKKESTGTLLARGGAMGPSAAAMCWQKKDALFKRVEKQLYAQAPYARKEALRHLAAFLSVSPARVALNSLKERPQQGDQIIAELLLAEAASGGPPVGRDLLATVKKEEGALANRLLAQWAPQVDTQRQRLKAPEENTRRDAVSELSNLGPLGAKELEGALSDDSARVALAAARALARGEGLSMTAMVKKQLSQETQVADATRLKWIELLGKSQEKECTTLLPGLLADERASETTRARAAVAWAACSGNAALPGLKPLLTSKSPVLRAAAIEALGEVPRAPGGPEMVNAALKDPEPLVQAAAAKAAGTLRMTARTPALVAMLEAGDVAVRLAAVQSLVLMPSPQAATPLARLLGQDADHAVRLACVEALAGIGGPDALGALTQASKKDASEKVKLAASAALRRLGFTPSTGTLRE